MSLENPVIDNKEFENLKSIGYKSFMLENKFLILYKTGHCVIQCPTHLSSKSAQFVEIIKRLLLYGFRISINYNL